jgi:hypothetical protein
MSLRLMEMIDTWHVLIHEARRLGVREELLDTLAACVFAVESSFSGGVVALYDAVRSAIEAQHAVICALAHAA